MISSVGERSDEIFFGTKGVMEWFLGLRVGGLGACRSSSSLRQVGIVEQEWFRSGD